LALEKLGVLFNQVVHKLKYTPRRLVVHPASQNMIIIETDHAAFTEKGKRRRREEMANVCKSTKYLRLTFTFFFKGFD